MRLIYRNHGKRNFGIESLNLHPRNAWEYLFVSKGSCVLTLLENDLPRSIHVEAPTAIITGPECLHGRSGGAEEKCEVFVFQFDDADPLMRSMIGNQGYRCIQLSPSDISQCKKLYKKCESACSQIGFLDESAQTHADVFAPLIYNIVATELSLLLLKHIPRVELGPSPNLDEGKVIKAIAWYESHLKQNPSIQEISAAIHISPVYLRRLFHKVRGISPVKAFAQIQFHWAKWFLRDQEMSIEQISENTGFKNMSSFSRAFKKYFGISPHTYRTRHILKTKKSHTK